MADSRESESRKEVSAYQEEQKPEHLTHAENLRTVSLSCVSRHRSSFANGLAGREVFHVIDDHLRISSGGSAGEIRRTMSMP